MPRFKFSYLVIFVALLVLKPTCFADLAVQPKKKIRVHLNWTPSVDFAGLYVADHLGWYAKNGLEVEFVFKGFDIVEQVLQGGAEIGMQSAHNVIQHIDKGASIKTIAAQYQLNPNSIVVPKSSSIKNVSDLKGKTLGYFTDQDFGVFQIILGHNGLKLADLNFKRLETFKESELVEILKSGVVDGIIAWEFNWTVTFSLLGLDVRVFPGHANGLHFYGVVFFSDTETLKTMPKEIALFLETTFAGWREVYRKPEYWSQWIVENAMPPENYILGSKSLTLKQQATELKLRQRYFREGVGMDYIGLMSNFKWNTSLKIAKTYGIISSKSSLKAKDVFDPTILNLIHRKKGT
jgi:NitT/TauT family transport system substrate-binding protein